MAAVTTRLSLRKRDLVDKPMDLEDVIALRDGISWEGVFVYSGLVPRPEAR
jgi:hypothetical protein